MLLTGPKRFVAALILEITVLIGIWGSVMAVVYRFILQNMLVSFQQNVSLALITKKKKNNNEHLKDRINALEKAIFLMHNQIQNIKVRLIVPIIYSLNELVSLHFHTMLLR